MSCTLRKYSGHTMCKEKKINQKEKDKGKNKTNNIHKIFFSGNEKQSIKETRGETLGSHLGLSHSQHELHPAMHSFNGKCRSLEH